MNCRLWTLVSLCACASSLPPAEPSPKAKEEAGPSPETACGDTQRFAALWRRAAPGQESPEAIALAYLDRCGTDEAVALLGQLVAFPTVSAREPAKDGPSFVAMAAFFESWAKAHGFDFRRYGDNDAWEIGFGKGPPSVAFVMHADVVPVDDGLDPAKAGAPGDLPAGWTQPPFRTTVIGDRIYGRGTEDDKGAIAVVLTSMRVLAELGYAPAGRIVAAMGTGEEHDWAGMRRYAEAAPKARHVISVDSNYPVVVAESGFVAWQLSAPLAAKPRAGGRCKRAAEASGGQFLTQVPGEATLILAPEKRGAKATEALLLEVKPIAEKVAADRGPPYRVEVAASGDLVTVKAFGDAVHSSVADEGHNALWLLSAIAEKLGLCEGGVKSVLEVVGRYFDGDHTGTKLALDYKDELMGSLLVAPTLLRTEKGEVTLGINMRRPRGLEAAEFGKRLDRARAEIQTNVSAAIKETGQRYVGEPALADTQGPLVSTLMEIYRAKTGEKDPKPIAIRGGTYARLFPGAVDFGPSLPGRPYRGHAPDEYVEMGAMRLMMETLGAAAVRLDRLPGAGAAAAR